MRNERGGCALNEVLRFVASITIVSLLRAFHRGSCEHGPHLSPARSDQLAALASAGSLLSRRSVRPAFFLTAEEDLTGGILQRVG